MEKQSVRTIDLGLVLSMIVIAIGVIALLLGRKGPDPERERALLEAKNLTLQLAAGGLGSLKQDIITEGRKPSSVASEGGYKKSLKLFGKQGKIGLDPWGKAFNFHFLEKLSTSGEETSNRPKVFIVVWSNGVNRQDETEFELLEAIINRSANKRDLSLAGDDLGYLRPVELQ